MSRQGKIISRSQQWRLTRKAAIQELEEIFQVSSAKSLLRVDSLPEPTVSEPTFSEPQAPFSDSSLLHVPIQISNHDDSSSVSSVSTASPCKDKVFESSVTSGSHFQCEDKVAEWQDLSLNLQPNESSSVISDIGEEPLPPKLLSRSEIVEFKHKFNIPNNAIDYLLHMLKPHHPNLPLSSKTLLGTPREIAPIEKMESGEFIYLGIEESLLGLLVNHNDVKNLTLVINIDGQSPYNNSLSSLWPILGMVREIEHEPCVFACYYGVGKPSVGNYLAKFVEELESLLADGIKFQGRVYPVCIGCFVGDAPADAYVKGIKGHAGFYGCGKCFSIGKRRNGCLVFTKLLCKLRTDDNFLAKEQPQHHIVDSPLALMNPPVGMVSQFPLDYMHLVLLGVLKRWLSYVKAGVADVGNKSNKSKVKGSRKKGKLSEAAISAMDEYINTLNEYRPSEFSRGCSPLSVSPKWKATEGRQFVVYIGPAVMKDHLSNDTRKNFLLLHAGIRIFCSKTLCLSMGEEANHFLHLFCQQSKKLFGPDFIVYNVHNLIHLYEDVKRFGCLDNFSAFPFESFQGKLKNMISGPSKPLQQIWKRLQELQLRPKEKVQKCADVPVGFCRHKSGPTCGLEGEQFQEVKYLGYKLSTDLRDSFVVLKCGSIVEIGNFVLCEYGMYIVGKSFATVRDLYDYPINSSKIGVYVVSSRISNYFQWPITDVKCKAFAMPLDGKLVIAELLHTS